VPHGAEVDACRVIDVEAEGHRAIAVDDTDVDREPALLDRNDGTERVIARLISVRHGYHSLFNGLRLCWQTRHKNARAKATAGAVTTGGVSRICGAFALRSRA
jgi:hypothetical protein